jgi:hypothetical protein
VYLYSLIDAEHDMRSYALDVEKILTKVKLPEMLNLVGGVSEPLKFST